MTVYDKYIFIDVYIYCIYVYIYIIYKVYAQLGIVKSKFNGVKRKPLTAFQNLMALKVKP